jgi:hypothetical protein
MARLNAKGLSIAHLTEEGWLAADTETKVTPTLTRDLWGFADILAISPNGTVLLVQATTASNMADRIKKVVENHQVPHLLARFVEIHVWGWYPAGTKFRAVNILLDHGGKVLVSPQWKVETA